MLKVVDGVPIIFNNTITKSEEKYHVSYNHSKKDYGIDTTALVIIIGNNERELFYILKGNHKEQYANCKNLKDCITYYISNKKNIHEFSDKFEHEYLI